jgi:membrane-anchored protein YejM (alkaline phosphatase superfamily)
MRGATPEIRALHAFSALRREPPEARVTSVPLPPLHADVVDLPAILLVLTESVRADDYGIATSPETAAVTDGRVDFREMRAVSSYTAVSLSAILTGRSQEGPRDAILAAPNLFDFAKAARDAGGRRPYVAYYSSQSEEVFETKDVRAAVDRFVTVETLLGHPLEDDEDIVKTSLDALVVDRFLADLPRMPRDAVVVLHLIGTHAPYHFTEADARFQPWDRAVAWSRLASLRNAYRNSIVAQDRSVARALRAFTEHAKGGPHLLVYTSDHGEAFGEHGAIHHGQNLYDEQVHVPAWTRGTMATATLSENRSQFVTHLDLLPTLLDAMGLWDNFAVRAAREKMAGRSLFRRLESRVPAPVTNCTGMFPCPVNTWGLFDGDRKLVAQTWDGGWSCLALEPGIGEVTAPANDPACARLLDVSRATFPRLPNGQPNR